MVTEVKCDGLSSLHVFLEYSGANPESQGKTSKPLGKYTFLYISISEININ